MTSKIDRFLAKPVEVTIAGEKYMVKPFTARLLPLLSRSRSDNPKISSEASQELFVAFMKQIDPTASKEQILEISKEFFEEIFIAMGMANGTDMKELKNKIDALENESD